MDCFIPQFYGSHCVIGFVIKYVFSTLRLKKLMQLSEVLIVPLELIISIILSKKGGEAHYYHHQVFNKDIKGLYTV